MPFRWGVYLQIRQACLLGDGTPLAPQDMDSVLKRMLSHAQTALDYKELQCISPADVDKAGLPSLLILAQIANVSLKISELLYIVTNKAGTTTGSSGT